MVRKCVETLWATYEPIGVSCAFRCCLPFVVCHLGSVFLGTMLVDVLVAVADVFVLVIRVCLVHENMCWWVP